MDLTFSAAEIAFRDRIRAFLAAELPAELRGQTPPGRDFDPIVIRRWQKLLCDHGLGAVHWPVSFGGLGATPVEQYLFQLECAMARAPVQLSFGLRMLAPVLMHFGSVEQQRRFLPKILSGEHWWCQGYSEPGAGSDLVSLKTQAVRSGEHYIVNGQKCWNTLGQHADWAFCLVRTDPTAKPQAGISLLLIDMRTPGITVRPTRLLDGTDEVNEIWFDNVRVPVDQRVGEENVGWTYAKFLLSHERVSIAGVGASVRGLADLKTIASRQTRRNGSLLEDPAFRRRLARIEIDLMALEYSNLRMLSSSDASASALQASILKIRGSEIRQALAELAVEALAASALPYATGAALDNEAFDITAAYLSLRKLSIFGGANEIQKNIVAQALIGS